MRASGVALAAALMLSGAAASAQDVRGVIDNLNRAVNPQQQQNPSDRERQIRAEEERYWRDYYGNRDDWRDRQNREFGGRGSGSSSARFDDRDMERIFRSEGALQIELRDLNAADLRRYENLPPGERRRWDEDFAQSARERFQRMSDSERRRYLDDVERLDRRGSGSSMPERRR
jgi:hypothetical protein